MWHGQNVKQVLTMHTKSNKLFTTMMKENDGISNCTIKVQDTVNSGVNIGQEEQCIANNEKVSI